MASPGRPGPKPKRLYLREVVLAGPDAAERPPARAVRAFITELERVGRLVAHGPLTAPAGDLLVLRAGDLAEAGRVLRTDPYRDLAGSRYALMAWNPETMGTGVNLEPPPARGSGRITQLQRVAVVVRDQEAALSWYRDVLGFAVRRHDPETGYVELALGQGTAAVSLVAPRPAWGEPYFSEALGRVGIRTGIAFETDSVPALELRLRHAGAVVTQAPRSEPWGGVTLRFTDPDGNEFLAFQKGGTASPRATPPRGGRGPERPINRPRLSRPRRP